MSSAIDCWKLISHISPQLRSLFIIKNALDQLLPLLCLLSLLSYSLYRLSDPLSAVCSIFHSSITSTLPWWQKYSEEMKKLALQPTSESQPHQGLMWRWELLVWEPSLRPVPLFNWSFIGDNQFISASAPGCIDLLSHRGVKCTTPRPPHYKPQALILQISFPVSRA